MRFWSLILVALSVVAMTSCGRIDTAAALPVELHSVPNMRMSNSANERVLYRFLGGTDGASPVAGLIRVNGALYGTTLSGGSGGNGTVFEVGISRPERVVYNFQGGTDGSAPKADLIEMNGTLYGTTYRGGGSGCSGYGCGTVFTLDPSPGFERVLYSFKGGKDGANPLARLIKLNGTLYGTTSAGGTGKSGGYGTVFEVGTSGAERVVHRFQGGRDGVEPTELIAVNGIIYGTTFYGGTVHYRTCEGCGTVFSVNPSSGQESVLHRFRGSDGADPNGLIDIRGTLYGTTFSGGAKGYGTIFKVGTSGVAQVLYSFKGGANGYYPSAPPTNVNGTLYGTTDYGGIGCYNPYTTGCGLVFALNLSSRAERAVYRFQGRSDGANPTGRMISISGSLYGTTYNGGGSGCNYYNGCGTVIAVTP